jgi:hypothetical protein
VQQEREGNAARVRATKVVAMKIEALKIGAIKLEAMKQMERSMSVVDHRSDSK